MKYLLIVILLSGCGKDTALTAKAVTIKDLLQHGISAAMEIKAKAI